jgi:hypothetical protein
MGRKSPQEKKELEYSRDHFTPGWDSSRMFPRTWKRKKTHANRQYRRKSQELLAGLKPGIDANDVVSDDLTAARFQKSITRKRLHKQGTITLGEKVKATLERRTEAVGRKVNKKRAAEAWAKSTLSTLNSLQGENLADFVLRAEAFRRGSLDERLRVMSSQDPVDRALCFLSSIGYGSGVGSAHEIYAVCRNPELRKGFATWFMRVGKLTTAQQRTQTRRRRKSRIAKPRTDN